MAIKNLNAVLKQLGKIPEMIGARLEEMAGNDDPNNPREGSRRWEDQSQQVAREAGLDYEKRPDVFTSTIRMGRALHNLGVPGVGRAASMLQTVGHVASAWGAFKQSTANPWGRVKAGNGIPKPPASSGPRSSPMPPPPSSKQSSASAPPQLEDKIPVAQEATVRQRHELRMQEKGVSRDRLNALARSKGIKPSVNWPPQQKGSTPKDQQLPKTPITKSAQPPAPPAVEPTKLGTPTKGWAGTAKPTQHQPQVPFVHTPKAKKGSPKQSVSSKTAFRKDAEIPELSSSKSPFPAAEEGGGLQEAIKELTEEIRGLRKDLGEKKEASPSAPASGGKDVKTMPGIMPPPKGQKTILDTLEKSAKTILIDKSIEGIAAMFAGS